MWESVVDIIVTAVSACFTWFDELMDAIPGAWSTIFTIIVILLLSRFLLGPLLGVAFSGGSDRAKINSIKKSMSLKDKARSEYHGDS